LAIRLRNRTAIVVAAMLGLWLGCGDDEGTACARHTDCTNSQEAMDVGRCAPEAACVEGHCRAWCPQTCSVALEDVNPCEEGYVCSESVSGVEPRTTCRATEIACDSADQCPLYRPGDGAWSCEDNICRFPGFSYLYEEE